LVNNRQMKRAVTEAKVIIFKTQADRAKTTCGNGNESPDEE
jgi:hypothetical protein